MNKTALKNFATNARKELIEKVKAKAFRIGITEESIKKAQFESSDAIYIDGKQLSTTEKKQREKLISRIKEIGYQQVVEKVAYTWFNRFTALRFMEVNDYLPTKVRILSSSNSDSFEPDIIKEALTVDLDIDKKLVYDWKINNQTDELYKYLVIKQCNSLNKVLPFMFETIDDYKEILFPDGLLAKGSFLLGMTDIQVIPEVDWEQVEIIGWLYQYYNTEINELVYNGDMSKKKVPKELLPAATQLFTPDWAVQYMVENSLGRLWIDGHSDSPVKKEWSYYLEKDGGSKSGGNRSLNPEDIKLFDPCMGSGHILVYAFEVLMTIYESSGYTQREAAKLILQKNLYGIDIDDRAFQLACFSVMMKARKYNRGIFKEDIKLNLCTIVESNELMDIDLSSINLNVDNTSIAKYLISVYFNAKEFGSILKVEERNYSSLDKALNEDTMSDAFDLFHWGLLDKIRRIMSGLLTQANIMTKKYDVVITNPPYLGNGRMSPLLNDYVKKNYPITKADLSMVMYQKAIDNYSKPKGFISFITTSSWLSLSSFEKFREKIINTVQIDTLVDFGTELFEGKVGHNPIVSWVSKNHIPNYNLMAIRLVDFCYSKRDQKKIEYFNPINEYYSNQEDFKKIPGMPITYWASENTFNILKSSQKVGDVGFSKKGLDTGNNNVYLRMWYEVDINKKGKKWVPLNKGGSFRKWYGNQLYLIDWEGNGHSLKTLSKANIRNEKFYFKEGLTWSDLTSGDFGARYFTEGFIFDATGPCYFGNNIHEMLAYMNSKVFNYLAKFTMSSMHYTNGSVANIPYKNVVIDKNKVLETVSISMQDWDSFETSWDFKKHPLLYSSTSSIKSTFEKWEQLTENQFSLLKSNEEEFNSLFIEMYGMQDELTPDVDEKNVSIRKADLERDIKSFISYSIGCMFGRYSLDEEGLVYGGGEFNPDKYNKFKVDLDNIVPILSEVYFEDDIVSKFTQFVEVTFDKEKLAENLEFVAEALGRKKGETATETIRRYILNDFFKDHLQIYKKRPIYWLFTSGKQKAFNCLIYMHRYNKSTLSRIRTDYLHELQIRMDAEKKTLLDVINGDGTTKEIANAKKELKSLDLKIEELRAYDEKLHHMADMQIEIDLDDGVTVNYAKFEGLLAPIK